MTPPSNLYFIGGIDTDIGKTLAVGLIARYWKSRKIRVVTQKLVQTGTTSEIADDILTHRRLMKIGLLEQDRDGDTCPYRFKLPASPHLAASAENRTIDPVKIAEATDRLRKQFDLVLIEGVGGLHVPLTPDVLTIDYLQSIGVPLILVTSGRLGSVNHTFQTLEIIVRRSIPLAGLVLNHHHETLPEIREDTLRLFRDRLKMLGRPGALVEMPSVDPDNPPFLDFSSLFQ